MTQIRQKNYDVAVITQITTADAGGSYTAAEQTLINELKTDLNLLLTAARNAGIIR